MKTLFEGKKVYAAIMVFVFIIIFFITFSITHNHYQYVLKNTINENKSTANLLSSLMYEYQKAATNIMESYARRPLFIDAVKKKDFNHVIPHLQSLSKHHTEIDALFITDQYGTLWANYPVDSSGFGKNLTYRDWYKGVSKKWRPYISTLYRRVVLEKGLAVAVAIEDLTSRRVFRNAFPLKQALDEISAHRGSQYDPDVVDACLRLFREKGYRFAEG